MTMCRTLQEGTTRSRPDLTGICKFGIQTMYIAFISFAFSFGLRLTQYVQYGPKYEDLYRSGFPQDPNMRRNSWSLKLLAVSPPCRRRGVGKALLDVISKKVRTSACFQESGLRNGSYLPNLQADTHHESIVVDVMDPYLVRRVLSIMPVGDR